MYRIAREHETHMSRSYMAAAAQGEDDRISLRLVFTVFRGKRKLKTYNCLASAKAHVKRLLERK